MYYATTYPPLGGGQPSPLSPWGPVEGVPTIFAGELPGDAGMAPDQSSFLGWLADTGQDLADAGVRWLTGSDGPLFGETGPHPYLPASGSTSMTPWTTGPAPSATTGSGGQNVHLLLLVVLGLLLLLVALR